MEKIKLKIALAGDGAVGKTSLIRRFVDDAFSADYLSTIGTTIASREIFIDQRDLTLTIWDLSGQIEMVGVQKLAFKNARGAMVVSDLTQPTSVMRASFWIHSLHRNAGDIPVVMLGNKLDLVKADSPNIDMLEGLSNVIGFDFIPTSALEGTGVEEGFTTLVRRILDPPKLNMDAKAFTSIFSTNYDFDGSADPLMKVEDQLITAFTNCHGDQTFAMDLIRKQFELANIDFRNPGTEGVKEIGMRLRKAAVQFMDLKSAQRFIKAANAIERKI